jgi:hypothetical protein
MVDNYQTFIGLAFSIRIVEAVGAGAYLTASFYVAASEYPKNVATVQVRPFDEIFLKENEAKVW